MSEKTLQNLIEDLTAERDTLSTQLTEAQARGKELETDLANLRALNAALVEQSASGRGVQMEYSWNFYSDDGAGIVSANRQSEKRWTPVHFAHNTDGLFIVWQRPARQAAEE